MVTTYTKEMLSFVDSMRLSGVKWKKLTRKFNKKFKTKKTWLAVRSGWAYNRSPKIETKVERYIKNITETTPTIHEIAAEKVKVYKAEKKQFTLTQMIDMIMNPHIPIDIQKTFIKELIK